MIGHDPEDPRFYWLARLADTAEEWVPTGKQVYAVASVDLDVERSKAHVAIYQHSDVPDSYEFANSIVFTMTAYATQTAGIEVEPVDLIWLSGLIQLRKLAEHEWILTNELFDADLTYTFVISGHATNEGLFCTINMGRAFEPEHEATDLLIDATYALVRSLVDPIVLDE